MYRVFAERMNSAGLRRYLWSTSLLHVVVPTLDDHKLGLTQYAIPAHLGCDSSKIVGWFFAPFVPTVNTSLTCPGRYTDCLLLGF